MVFYVFLNTRIGGSFILNFFLMLRNSKAPSIFDSFIIGNDQFFDSDIFQISRTDDYLKKSNNHPTSLVFVNFVHVCDF
jgi:hypothetical protein